MKSQTLALVAAVAGLIGQAAELQAAGAVRPEHETKWGALRVGLEQLNDAAKAIDQAADQAAPQTPDAAALADLAAKVAHVGYVLELHSTLIDRLADLAEAKA
ncbi:hypothetical protein [Roseateles sp. LKC17W]|uniref:Chemotaxis protein n=1 Tax=Pelomonas margarita TaxID=3299031 RepID=A0ABW7FFN2_9BURK